MILNGDWGSEKSHDAITTDLVHKTVVLMDRIHENLKHGPQNFQRILRIEFIDQRGRPADVSKDNGDMLAFSEHGAAGTQYPLDQLGRQL
jgi:hypothetical protein